MVFRQAPVELPGLAPMPGQPFGVYLHVPFCLTRCGYCDFNTYTPAQLGGVSGPLAAGAAGGARTGGRQAGRTDGAYRVCGWRDAIAARGSAWPRCWTWCGTTLCWRPTPKSAPRPTPSRRGRSSSPRSARPVTRGCRSACSRWPRGCWQPWTGCTRRAGRRPRPPRR